jgi:hypothetical protein
MKNKYASFLPRRTATPAHHRRSANATANGLGTAKHRRGSVLSLGAGDPVKSSDAQRW